MWVLLVGELFPALRNISACYRVGDNPILSNAIQQFAEVLRAICSPIYIAYAGSR